MNQKHPAFELDELADSLVHGLLSETEDHRARARAASDPTFAAAVERAQARRAALLAAPTCEPSEELLAAALAATQGISQREARWHRRRRAIARSLGGLVMLAACIIGIFNFLIEQRTPPGVGVQLIAQREVQAGSRGSMRVVVQKIGGSEPAADQRVTLSLKGAKTGSFVLAGFTTDAEGTASPTFTFPDWPAGTYSLSVSVNGQRHLERDVTLRRDFRIMLSTDKPQYQPGQTIHLRALSLKRAGNAPLANEKATFTIADPQGNIIFRRSAQTSAFGIAAADCELATLIREGPYTIRVEIGSTTSERTVDVRKYVLPKFKVGVELNAGYYAPGAEIKGTIDVRYFFGKPVDGSAEVTLRPLGVAADEIRLPKVKLKDGKGSFTSTLPSRLFGREQESGNARVEVVTVVTDTAGQEVTRVLSRLVTTAALKIDVVPETSPLAVGLPQKLYVMVTRPDGEPVEAEVGIGEGTSVLTTAEGVATLEWTPSSTSEKIPVWAKATGSKTTVRKSVDVAAVNESFVLRTDAGGYDAGGTVTLSAFASGSQPVFVDLIKDGQTILTGVIDMADGRGTLDVDLPTELSGAVLVDAYRFGEAGLPIRVSRPIFVRPAGEVKVAVAMDRPEHRPGDAASMTFTLTNPDGSPATGAVSLAVVDEAALNVMKDRPGMEGAFFSLEDELLKPVVTLYNIDPLAPGIPDDRLRAALSRSADRGVNPAERLAAERMQRYERADVWYYMERGWGTLNADEFSARGVKGLLASSHGEALRRFQSELRRDREGVIVAWMVLAVLSILIGLSLICLYAPSKIVIAFVVLFALFILFAALMPAMGKARSSARGLRPPTAEMVPAAPPGAIADPMSPPGPLADIFLGTSGVSRSNATLAPTRVREWFPETLLWRPELITDDQGRATISFDLADSITNWKALGSAITPRGSLGSFDADLRVFQPFFVDVNAPVALVQKDTIDLPLVIYNYLDQPQRVTLSAEVGDWCELLSDPDFEIDLKPGEVRSVALRLRASKVGRHTLLVNAAAGEVSDAIRKSIEVVPDGVPVESLVSGEIDSPLAAAVTLPPNTIEGSASLLVRVFPSTFSEVLGGLDGLLAMPHGCFEQTSSTTYPNVLALDYLRTTKKAVPEVEARARQFIHIGYQRLLSFEVPGGGFDWFGRAPANVVLSAYGLMEFTDMARVHDVDPAVIDRTRAWLLSKRNADGTWTADAHMLNDGLAGSVHRGNDLTLATTAYVAWAVFDGGKETAAAALTLDWLLQHEPATIDNPHTLAILCNALLAMAPDKASPFVKQLVSLAQRSEDGKAAHWDLPSEARTTFTARGQAGDIETTALALLALARTKSETSLARAGLNWLAANRDARGSWHSTQGTVLALKAMLASSGKPLGDGQSRDIVITANGKEAARRSISAEESDVVQLFDLTPLLASNSAAGRPLEIQVQDTTATGCTAQIASRAFVPRPDTPSEGSTLGVEVTYDKASLKVGDMLKAKARVRNRGTDPAQMVMLDLPVPAGFAPDLESFDALASTQKISRYEVTPRSVIVYLLGIPAGGSVSLDYRLTPTMPVDVTAAAAAAWEYYDPANRAVGRSTRIKAQ